MTDRRQFIQSGLMLSAVASTGINPLFAGIQAIDQEHLLVDDFVFDNRFGYARKLARQAETQGITLAEMSGDLTRLWMTRYSALWKQAPMTLAGVTTEDGLFVLGTLAADHGMRIVQRRELVVPSRFSSDRQEKLISWTIAPRGHKR